MNLNFQAMLSIFYWIQFERLMKLQKHFFVMNKPLVVAVVIVVERSKIQYSVNVGVSILNILEMS